MVTIFSAPNYMSTFDNDAAAMMVDVNLKIKFKIFKKLNERNKKEFALN